MIKKWFICLINKHTVLVTNNVFLYSFEAERNTKEQEL